VLSATISQAWAAGKIVAAVCHGPASLAGPVDEAGHPLVAGKRVSSYTDSEERAAGLDKTVPFLLETRLRSLGAQFEKGPDFKPFAVRDGNLVTGQNPASSEKVARLTMEAAESARS
jgi:putative intracellular protease/amidase